ncbi:MAG: CARDB domain-containing protein, partial [Terriglobales bacterium]
CIDFGPAESQPVSIPVLALSGFSKPISWQWISTGGLNVSITNPTGSSGGPPYSNISSTFINNETSNIFTQVHFVLAITIANGNGTATKYFNVPVYPFINGCAFSAGRAAAGKAGDGTFLPSYWKRGPVSSSAALRTVERSIISAGLPDLQIKPVDVSMSPSIPRVGDTLDVRFKLVNAGDGAAIEVPVALQVNGSTVATETYSLKPGASTLGGFQWKLDLGDAYRETAAMRPVRYKAEADAPVGGLRRPGQITAQLVIDPGGAFKQRSTAYKSVALTKAGLSTPVDAMPTAAERVYLEMNTICSGFRISSGAVVDCDAGADLDITIEDFKNSRFTLNAALGIADLGVVEPSRADAAGVLFNANAALVLGHTYAVQVSGGRVGYVKFSASLTPRQLAAQAKLRFGLNGVRILKKLGGDTGSTGAGDVAGRISADALMYFDMTFRP